MEDKIIKGDIVKCIAPVDDKLHKLFIVEGIVSENTISIKYNDNPDKYSVLPIKFVTLNINSSEILDEKYCEEIIEGLFGKFYKGKARIEHNNELIDIPKKKLDIPEEIGLKYIPKYWLDKMKDIIYYCIYLDKVYFYQLRLEDGADPVTFSYYKAGDLDAIINDDIIKIYNEIYNR